MNDTVVCETNKAAKCIDCPLRKGCGLLAVVHPDDVLGAPCGRVIGYSVQSEFDGREYSLHYWVAEAAEWEKVKNTAKRPDGIAWVFIGEIRRPEPGVSE